MPTHSPLTSNIKSCSICSWPAYIMSLPPYVITWAAGAEHGQHGMLWQNTRNIYLVVLKHLLILQQQITIIQTKIHLYIPSEHRMDNVHGIHMYIIEYTCIIHILSVLCSLGNMQTLFCFDLNNIRYTHLANNNYCIVLHCRFVADQ